MKARRLSDKELMKRKFRKFLYDNDALEAFEKNVVSMRGSSVAKQFKIVDASTIQGAFYWEDSPEGHSFWSKLNYEWRKVYKI